MSLLRHHNNFFFPSHRAVEKGKSRGSASHPPPRHPPYPLPFPGAKNILYIKSKNIKFLHVNNIWDLFIWDLFIYWTRHKWQKVDSFFWICYFSSKLSYHSYQQRVCKFLFLTETFVKTKSNLMCGSLKLM